MAEVRKGSRVAEVIEAMVTVQVASQMRIAAMGCPGEQFSIEDLVEPRLHNNASKGASPFVDKIFKSQNYSGFCNVKVPLVNSLCFNNDSPL